MNTTEQSEKTLLQNANTFKQKLVITIGFSSRSRSLSHSTDSEVSPLNSTTNSTPLLTTAKTPREPMVEHEIRLLAYDLYEQRGRRDGHALEDWLQAEKEILSRTLMHRG
jgi:Protein of unknown function (DUF2934)